MSSTVKGTLLDVETRAADGARLPLLYDGLSESLDAALTCFETQEEARARELLACARLIALQLLLSLHQCTEAGDLSTVLRRLTES